MKLRWDLGRIGLLLAALLLLEIAGTKAWELLPLKTFLPAFSRDFPAFTAWAAGSQGLEALSEMAALAWTGLVRLLDILLLWGMARGWGMTLPRWGSFRRASPHAFGAALAFGVLVGILAFWQGWHSLATMLAGGPNPVYAEAGTALLGILCMVGIGPLAEEMVFRGALLPFLREALPVWMAEGLSAALFALAHVLMGGPLMLAEPWRALPQFAGGLAFARLATRTEGILAPWLLHMAANGFILALQLIIAM